MFTILAYWRIHKEYQNYLVNNILQLCKTDPDRVLKYEKTLSKLYIIDLDSLLSLLAPYYSITGDHAKNQPELIRSFVLISELKYHSITKLINDLNHDELLCIMIGLPKS